MGERGQPPEGEALRDENGRGNYYCHLMSSHGRTHGEPRGGRIAAQGPFRTHLWVQSSCLAVNCQEQPPPHSPSGATSVALWVLWAPGPMDPPEGRCEAWGSLKATPQGGCPGYAWKVVQVDQVVPEGFPQHLMEVKSFLSSAVETPRRCKSCPVSGGSRRREQER